MLLRVQDHSYAPTHPAHFVVPCPHLGVPLTADLAGAAAAAGAAAPGACWGTRPLRSVRFLDFMSSVTLRRPLVMPSPCWGTRAQETRLERVRCAAHGGACQQNRRGQSGSRLAMRCLHQGGRSTCLPAAVVLGNRRWQNWQWVAGFIGAPPIRWHQNIVCTSIAVDVPNRAPHLGDGLEQLCMPCSSAATSCWRPAARACCCPAAGCRPLLQQQPWGWWWRRRGRLFGPWPCCCCCCGFACCCACCCCCGAGSSACRVPGDATRVVRLDVGLQLLHQVLLYQHRS